MAAELKIRIKNPNEVEEKLKSVGAAFFEEERFTDTYFHQPQGVVLKISSNDKGNNLVHLKSSDGKFEIVSSEKIKDLEKAESEMSAKYGIKAVLKGKRKYYQLDDLKITINLIDDVGEFLILTGESPTEEFITQKLGIKNPEYIRVSFDELKHG